MLQKILKDHKFLIVILLCGAILRFATVGKLMTFTPDEAYQTYLAQTIIKNFHIIWIGLSAGSFGLFLGPLWIYFISPFLAFSHGDPLILGYLGSFIGVVSIVLLYYLSLEMYNKKTAIISSLLYTFSPLVIYYDQKAYPTGIAFLSILLTLSLYKTKDSKYWWVTFTLAYATVFNVHLSLLPIIIVAIYWWFTHKKTLNKKVFAISSIIFLIVISPLIGFDYFHNASNITAPFVALKLPHPPLLPTIEYHASSLFNSLGRVFYLPAFKNSTDEILWPCTFTPSSTFSHAPILWSLFGLFVLFAFFLLKVKAKRDEKVLVVGLSLSFIIPFVISTLTNPVEYYLVGLFPILFIMIGVLVSCTKNIKKIIYPMVVLICILGSLTVLTAKGEYGLAVKKTLINKVMANIGESSFTLNEAGDCHHYESWRYLFSVYAKSPFRSSQDNSFGWLYSDEILDAKADYEILIKETKSSEQVNPNYKYKIEEGGFSAFIY